MFKLGFGEGRQEEEARGGERPVQYNIPEPSLQGLVPQNQRSDILQLRFDD